MDFHERAKALVEKAPQMTVGKYIDESCSLIADLLETLELAEENGGIIVAERDELKADIVRVKIHLESAERAAKANGAEVERLTAENETLHSHFKDECGECDIVAERDRLKVALDVAKNGIGQLRKTDLRSYAGPAYQAVLDGIHKAEAVRG